MATAIDENLRLTFQVICNLEFRLPPKNDQERLERLALQTGVDEITRELAGALEKIVVAKIQELANDRT